MEGASDLRNCKTNNEWAFACDPESGPEVFFSRMLLDPILISMAVPNRARTNETCPGIYVGTLNCIGIGITTSITYD